VRRRIAPVAANDRSNDGDLEGEQGLAYSAEMSASGRRHGVGRGDVGVACHRERSERHLDCTLEFVHCIEDRVARGGSTNDSTIDGKLGVRGRAYGFTCALEDEHEPCGPHRYMREFDQVRELLTAIAAFYSAHLTA
jgi:hypothetical protein